MENALAALKVFDWGADEKALIPIDNAIKQANQDSKKISQIELLLLDILSDNTPRPGKEFICRRLAVIGSNRAISVLSKLLVKSETTDMARYALERMPINAASEVLRNAMVKTEGMVRIGIIDSLGKRRDKHACAALAELLNESDTNLVNAAATALGYIANEQAEQALAAAKSSVPASCQIRVLDAYLCCADMLVTQGNAARAMNIYAELIDENIPEVIRCAAKQAIQRVKEKEVQL